jgi:hypothetical protein
LLAKLAPGFADGTLKPFPIDPRFVYRLEDAKSAYLEVAGSAPQRVVLVP